jgi:hypothetical protein
MLYLYPMEHVKHSKSWGQMLTVVKGFPACCVPTWEGFYMVETPTPYGSAILTRFPSDHSKVQRWEELVPMILEE